MYAASWISVTSWEHVNLKVTENFMHWSPATLPYGYSESVENSLVLAYRNLPEMRSTHEVLGVPNVSARFGTYPQIWNIAMSLVASLVPKVILPLTIV